MIYLAAAVFAILVSCCITGREGARYGEFYKDKNGWGIAFDKTEVRNRFFLYLSALPLFLISALRFGIGTDYFYTYAPGYNVIASGGHMHFELLFHWLVKIITMFTSNYQWLFVVTSFLFIFIVYNTLYRVSKNIPMALVIFFLSYVYFISLNNIRQALASAFILIAIRCLIEDKVWKYIFFCIVAGLIHQVAFISLAFIIVKIKKINISVWWQMVGTAIGMVLIRFGAKYIIKLISMIPRLNLYFNLEELLKYTNRTISTKFILLNIVIFLIYLIIEQTEDGFVADTDWKISKWAQTFYLLICAADGIVPATYRILRVIIFIQYLTVPNAIEHCKDERHKWMYYILVVIAFVLMFLELYFAGSEQVFPYVSIFDV